MSAFIHNHNTSVMYYLTKAASNLEIDFSLLCIYTTFFIQRYYFFLISWRLITLQYCSGFCHALT